MKLSFVGYVRKSLSHFKPDTKGTPKRAIGALVLKFILNSSNNIGLRRALKTKSMPSSAFVPKIISTSESNWPDSIRSCRWTQTNFAFV